MIVHPRQGQTVQVWYCRRVAPSMPLHGKVGRVVIVARGPGPRNHGIEIGGTVYAVPCGNIRSAS